MKKRMILSILGIVMLLAGIGVGLYLVREQQLITKKASVSGGIVDVYLDPVQKEISTGEQVTLNVMLDPKNVSIQNIRLMMPLSAETVAKMTSVTIRENRDLTQGTALRFIPAPVLDETTNIITINASSTDSSGFTSAEAIRLATISFEVADTAQGTITIPFDLETSQVLSKLSGADILSVNLSPGVYSLGGSNPDPSVTPTLEPNAPTPTHTPIPSNTPIPSRTPIPTATLTPVPGQPTNSPAPTSTITPTPTTGSSGGGGGSTGPTPTPYTSISITSPVEGANLTDRTPTFSGTAASRARILVSISGSNISAGTTTALASGAWSFTPTTNLTVGAHTATLKAYDANNYETSVTVTFGIVTGTSSGTGTGTGTGSTGTQTTDGTGELMVAGSTLPTLAIIGGGLLMILLGAFTLVLARRT